MNTTTFNALCKIVYNKSGIVLSENKLALLSARINRRLRVLNIADPESYLTFLNAKGNDNEFVSLIDAISTNVTSFYRENEHFGFLADALKQWVGAGQSSFTGWCAAASTGEEPYTLAMTCAETLSTRGATTRILATDISTDVLDKCREGIYRNDKMDGIPTAYRSKYFRNAPHSKLGDPQSQVTEPLRKLLSFHRLNLSSPPFPMKGPMDFIFIRNVMIYFDNETRVRLLKEAYRLLKPGGYLMVGHCEGLTNIASDFQFVRPSIYTK
jgi:chemotaxis protein methyltransferase CheR